MISASLAGSKRLANCPERAAMLYVLTLARATNLEGRFEADVESLLDYASRYGRVRGWTDETIQADRDHLSRVGLWIVYGDPGDEIVQVVDFHKHNRTDPRDEMPSELPPPPGYSDEEERRRYRRPPFHRTRNRAKSTQPQGALGNPKEPSGALGKGKGKREGKQELKGEGEGHAAPASARTRGPLASTASGLLQTLRERTRPDDDGEEDHDPDAWITEIRDNAVTELAPWSPTPESAHDLALALSAITGVAPQDPQVRSMADTWAQDRFTLSAAVQLVERLADPEKGGAIDNPISYLRAAVPSRAQELNLKVEDEIEKALDRRGDRRHRALMDRPRAYNPQA